MSAVANEKEPLAGAKARAAADDKLTRLKRMRATATALLVAMIVLLFACVVWQAAYPWLAWPRAFAEAGTVGAIADWYAVVALFRHPMGLPIPHTAIVPNNQARIGESLGSFVEENFLTPELVVGRLSEYNAAHALATWLAERENSAAIAGLAADSLPRLLERLDEADIEALFDRFVFAQARTLDVSRIAGQVLDMLTEGDRHQPLLDRGLSAMKTWLTDNVDLIKAKFSEASRFTPALLDAYIVNKFVEGIVALIHEAADNPDHELRGQFDEAVRALSLDLQTAPAYRRFGRLLLRDGIRHFKAGGYSRVIIDRVRLLLAADAQSAEPVVRGVIAGALVSFGEAIESTPTMQKKLNAWWLELARALLARYRNRLSLMIADVVKGWNAQEVSGKFEAEIGRDLQFIRINGTFVGGFVGVVIHTCVFALGR